MPSPVCFLCPREGAQRASLSLCCFALPPPAPISSCQGCDEKNDTPTMRLATAIYCHHPTAILHRPPPPPSSQPGRPCLHACQRTHNRLALSSHAACARSPSILSSIRRALCSQRIYDPFPPTSHACRTPPPSTNPPIAAAHRAQKECAAPRRGGSTTTPPPSLWHRPSAMETPPQKTSLPFFSIIPSLRSLSISLPRARARARACAKHASPFCEPPPCCRSLFHHMPILFGTIHPIHTLTTHNTTAGALAAAALAQPCLLSSPSSNAAPSEAARQRATSGMQAPMISPPPSPPPTHNLTRHPFYTSLPFFTPPPSPRSVYTHDRQYHHLATFAPSRSTGWVCP